jgi:hypothetical protein
MADSQDHDAPDADAASAANDAAKHSSPDNEASKPAPESASDAGGAEAQTHRALVPIVAERITPADFAEAIAKAAADGKDHSERWQWPGYPTLAAMIALAAVVGALSGAATTAGLLRGDRTPVAAAASQAAQDSVAKLGAQLAALKAGLGAAQRNAHAQLSKLADRLDRTEKAQAEPAAKIAKIAEGLDRVERRIARAEPEIVTGSIPAAKPDVKPPVADGWHLRDYFSGRAVVESRSGQLFEIAPGSNLPGLGRVETIRRENGQVVVVTRNGIIAAALPRPGRLPVPRYLPYLD